MLFFFKKKYLNPKDLIRMDPHVPQRLTHHFMHQNKSKNKLHPAALWIRVWISIFKTTPQESELEFKQIYIVKYIKKIQTIIF